MSRNGFLGAAGAVFAVALLGQAFAGAQVPAKAPKEQPLTGAGDAPSVSASSLMSVRIPKKVMADGQELAAGNYMVRVTAEAPSPVVGQTAAQQHWVEFLQGGQVKGRALATVLTSADAKAIAKQGTPAAGTAKVESLVGNDYMRVWINKGGTNYLIYLTVPSA